jgi:ubiquinone/menaquinone biosynthesis C-methylase UbiE
MPAVELFDPIADDYDRWYDTPEGNTIFLEELNCLRRACREYTGRWLEVGVGTGRFASALGVSEGIDPSPAMLEIAAGRGIKTLRGSVESLPYPDMSFDGLLMVLVLCFLENPEQALGECRRVLRPDGRLLLGTIPAESPWGKLYIKQGREGHPAYSRARFYAVGETLRLFETAGFELENAASALLLGPESGVGGHGGVKPGIIRDAGFLGLLFRITSSRAAGRGILEG